MSIFNRFVTNKNKEYGQGNTAALANQLFKDTVDIGSAIVSVLSNTGIAGFKFHVPQREQIQMQSEATDHYIDINRPVQDHIAIKPVTITLQGLQGEYFYSVNQIEDAIALVTPTMSLVKQFLPKLQAHTMRIKTLKQNYNKEMLGLLSAQTINGGNVRLRDKASTALNSLNAIDLYKTFQDLYKLKSAQARAFLFFEALMNSRALFSVETSWKRYDNMVITGLNPLRDENADITDFTVSFKQINLAITQVTTVENAVGRRLDQIMDFNIKGVDKGKKVSTL